MSPDDWASGTDVQLERAVQLAMEALAEHPAAAPPSTDGRPPAAARRSPPAPAPAALAAACAASRHWRP